MSTSLPSLAVYAGAAFVEIAGCFAFWGWLRLDRSPLWVLPGLVFLALFALLLTRVDLAFAGRATQPTAGSTSPPRSPGCGRSKDRRRIDGIS